MKKEDYSGETVFQESDVEVEPSINDYVENCVLIRKIVRYFGGRLQFLVEQHNY